MKATTSNEIGASPRVTTFATAGLATGPPRDIVRDRDAANADDFRPKFGRGIESIAARVVRGFVGVVHALRDSWDRRQTVRDLRRLGRSRLADIGIDPHEIAQVADAMIAARRDRAAIDRRHLRPRSE